MTNAATRRPIRNLRWVIIGIAFLATAVNYLDRQCLSVAAPTICKEFEFSNSDYASIVTCFLIAYTIMQFLSGVIVDKIGVRRGMTAFLSWWCVAGVLHALATGLGSFRLFRFLLGMGEAGNWPASTKAVSEWFPAKERGLAIGIFDSGSSLGALLAPPVVAWLIMHYGWRTAFVVTGLTGFFVLLLWLLLYRRPEDHPRLSDTEKNLILSERQVQLPPEQQAGGLKAISRLLCFPAVWGVISGRLLSDCVWWFYVYWLPKYLADQRGFSLGQIAAIAWIPFVTVDLGNLFGGGFSAYLIRSGWSLNSSRKALLRIGAAGMLAAIPAGLSGSAGLSVAFISLATFAYGIWGTMMLTLPTDLFPASQVGVVSGMSGSGAGLGGIAFTALTGFVVDRVSYLPIFVAAALLPVVALVAVEVLIPRIGQVSLMAPKPAAARAPVDHF